MAKASITSIEVPVTTTQLVETVVLELTREEAQVLKNITAKISGCPYKSQRKHIASIAKALYELGFAYDLSYVEGTINCATPPEGKDSCD